MLLELAFFAGCVVHSGQPGVRGPSEGFWRGFSDCLDFCFLQLYINPHLSGGGIEKRRALEAYLGHLDLIERPCMNAGDYVFSLEGGGLCCNNVWKRIFKRKINRRGDKASLGRRDARKHGIGGHDYII